LGSRVARWSQRSARTRSRGHPVSLVNDSGRMPRPRRRFGLGTRGYRAWAISRASSELPLT